MTAKDADKGFIVIGECPELPPLEELETLIDKLDLAKPDVAIELAEHVAHGFSNVLSLVGK